MINLITTWLLSAALLFFTSRIIDGFQIPNFGVALAASFVIGLLNVFIRPLISFLALPANLITLGLFTFVVNAVILKLADGLMSSIYIDSWVTATIAAFFLAVVQLVANLLLPGKRNFLGRN